MTQALLSFLAAVVLTWAPAALLTLGPDPWPVRVRLLAIACCAALSAHALFPRQLFPRRWTRALWAPLWGAAVTALGLLVAVRTLPWPAVRGGGLLLAVGVGAVTFLLVAAEGAAAAWLRGADAGRRTVWAALGAIASAPVWLGPLAVRGTLGQHFPDTLVALSPLAHLAALLDVDYLRGTWFYEHSPLSSLRYDYPSVPAIAGAYLVLGAALTLAAEWKGRHNSQPTEEGQ